MPFLNQLENGLENGLATSINHDGKVEKRMRLEVEDGAFCEGYSFGAEKSVSGELVFQTGMVGYPESITDPSYRGQILVVTFPLVGNYGVPSRKTKDRLIESIPAHFEAAEIHVAGLIVASYAGEEFSHHLATSSLGTWLKEQEVPAMHGVDTRALTKRIREQGSMLGKITMEMPLGTEKSANVRQVNGNTEHHLHNSRSREYEKLDWANPNTRNLVNEGKKQICHTSSLGQMI